jgi:hypothetical protein
MPLPFLHRPDPDPGLGSDRARRVADTLARDIAVAIARLGTADKNRALLAIAAFVADQLEALEDSNET